MRSEVRQSQYLEFFECLNRYGIRYLVIGGIAMSLHGVSRATLDIDIAVDADFDQSEAWEEVCKDALVHPLNQPSFKDMYNAEKRNSFREEKNLIAYVLVGQREPYPKIDVMFDPPWDFRRAYGRRIEKNIRGVIIPLVHDQDLISMKQVAGREKDLADISALNRRHL